MRSSWGDSAEPTVHGVLVLPEIWKGSGSWLWCSLLVNHCRVVKVHPFSLQKKTLTLTLRQLAMRDGRGPLRDNRWCRPPLLLSNGLPGNTTDALPGMRIWGCLCLSEHLKLILKVLLNSDEIRSHANWTQQVWCGQLGETELLTWWPCDHMALYEQVLLMAED